MTARNFIILINGVPLLTIALATAALSVGHKRVAEKREQNSRLRCAQPAKEVELLDDYNKS